MEQPNFIRMGSLILESFRRHALTGRAAALAFISTVALVPALAASLVLLGLFGALDSIHADVRSWVVQNLAPGFGDKVDALFAQLGATPVGWASVLVLAALSFWILIVMERTLNSMWGIRRPRSLVRRTMVYWTLFTGGTIQIVVSLGAVPFLLSSDPSIPRAVAYAVPFVVSCVVLSLTYLFMPSTFVPAKAAFAGGVIGGILFELLKLGALSIGTGVISTALPYGAFIAGPLFLLWVYLGWASALAGAGIAYAVQHSNAPRREVDLPAASQTLKERVALRATLLVSRSFVNGTEAPTIDDSLDDLRARAEAELRKIRD